VLADFGDHPGRIVRGSRDCPKPALAEQYLDATTIFGVALHRVWTDRARPKPAAGECILWRAKQPLQIDSRLAAPYLVQERPDLSFELRLSDPKTPSDQRSYCCAAEADPRRGV
jgi:hypothetical protein